MFMDELQRDVEFWDLWEKNKKVFFGKCLRLMNGDVYEAEDMLSAAMLKAREKMIDNLDGVRNFKSWALRLTENVCLDQLRKDKRFICYSEVPDSLVQDESNNSHMSEESIERYCSREELLQGIFQFIHNLPVRLREPALLRFFFLESYHNIAGRLNITEDNARKRIQQARLAMRCKYGDKIGIFFSTEEKNITRDSSVLKMIRQSVDTNLNAAEPELNFGFKTAWTVNTAPVTGSDREVPVFLPFKPVWRGKGFVSFMKYISMHRGGLKKHLELGQMLSVIGQWDPAEKILRHIIKKRPRSFQARIFLGEMLMKSERTEAAASLFQETVSLVYRGSSRHFLSGMASMSRNETADAINHFKKAREMEPSNLAFCHAKGICLFMSGRYEEAYGFFSDFLKARPRDLVSLVYCCESSILTNQTMRALNYADRILMDNPYDFFALKRKSSLAGQKTRPDKGEIKRLNCLTEQFEKISMIIKDSENYKFTDGGS
jgi:RNA polymerase sigma factor (sigma-70 family)